MLLIDDKDNIRMRNWMRLHRIHGALFIGFVLISFYMCGAVVYWSYMTIRSIPSFFVVSTVSIIIMFAIINKIEKYILSH